MLGASLETTFMKAKVAVFVDMGREVVMLLMVVVVVLVAEVVLLVVRLRKSQTSSKRER